MLFAPGRRLFSVASIVMVLVGLVLANRSDAMPALLSRTALVIAVTSAALTLLYAAYRIPPPLISLGVVTLLYALAARAARSAKRA